jgi:hypothetical protein
VDLTICILSKFLVVHSFVARRFGVRLDASAPSGEIWNYLLRRISCNVEDLTTSTPFRDLTQLAYVYLKHVLQQTTYRVKMFAHQVTCAAFHFVI